MYVDELEPLDVCVIDPLPDWLPEVVWLADPVKLGYCEELGLVVRVALCVCDKDPEVELVCDGDGLADCEAEDDSLGVVDSELVTDCVIVGEHVGLRVPDAEVEPDVEPVTLWEPVLEILGDKLRLADAESVPVTDCDPLTDSLGLPVALEDPVRLGELLCDPVAEPLVVTVELAVFETEAVDEDDGELEGLDEPLTLCVAVWLALGDWLGEADCDSLTLWLEVSDELYD